MAPPAFEALYYADRLRVVNPAGDVGLITLWSPLRTVERKLDEISPELLDPARSRLAVVSNLYGDGMFAMFCNLLFNPQVRHLVAIGEDLGLPTADEIAAFIERGLEDAELLGTRLTRVVGTQRVFADVPGFDADALRRRLTFRAFGKLSRRELGGELTAYLAELPQADACEERIRVDIPDAVPAGYLPSAVTAHQVVRRGPLDCWEELVVRCVRFGHPVELANGPRVELLNAKVVITDPAEDPEPALARYGFRLEDFRAYARRILDPELPEGIAYTYGNRLRGYFGQGAAGTDTLATAIGALRADPESRHAYVSLWDTAHDLPDLHGSMPCLTTLFFRRTDGRLSLSATYRAHNLLTAWLQNVYGLMAIQRHVADAVGLPVGPITVVSHSLGADPRSPRFALGRSIAEGWRRDDDVDRVTGKSSLREDPNGYFVVSVDGDRGVIVAEHRFGGVLVKRYEAARAVDVEVQVASDMAVSLVSHALWLGRELTIKEQQLRALRR